MLLNQREIKLNVRILRIQRENISLIYSYDTQLCFYFCAVNICIPIPLYFCEVKGSAISMLLANFFDSYFKKIVSNGFLLKQDLKLIEIVLFCAYVNTQETQN